MLLGRNQSSLWITDLDSDHDVLKIDVKLNISQSKLFKKKKKLIEKRMKMFLIIILLVYFHIQNCFATINNTDNSNNNHHNDLRKFNNLESTKLPLKSLTKISEIHTSVFMDDEDGIENDNQELNPSSEPPKFHTAMKKSSKDIEIRGFKLF